MSLKIETKSTTPYEGQKPGTSGLRKAVKVFQQVNYTENFVQCIIDSQKENVTGHSIVLGGDGRYFGKEAVQIILQMCAANKVKKVFVGQNGIFSTPAVSHMIRKYQTAGGILLTASHNPGGPDNDFGIKFNISNGGPATDMVTNDIYALTQTIKEYKLCPELQCDIGKLGTQTFQVEGSEFIVEVVDPVKDYTAYMKEIFDFGMIKDLLNGKDGRPPFKVLMNGMHGVTGPYIRNIFLEEMGCSEESVTKIVPLDDFGGHHPDPNLTYAADLVEDMKAKGLDLGAAFDGDGDRNMILGKNAFFVTPSDSVAVIANNATLIPYFQKTGLKGLARSMPTSAALDKVAQGKNVQCFEVPTGWKYFGNLMDAGKLSICGEESFGTGSDHIREKDGIWAALAWLSIVAGRKMSIEEILMDHWRSYGRNFFLRYDYENCESAPCNEMMAKLDAFCDSGSMIGQKLDQSHTIAQFFNFQYKDPIDGSEAKKQGICVIMEDGSRMVFRLSGTGSSGSTVRLYIESQKSDASLFAKDARVVLDPMVQLALQISELKKYTGRDEPTVIT